MPPASRPPSDPTFDDTSVDAGSREHYADADLYDHEYRRRRDDVGFYLDLARRLSPPGGHILELGAGTGRVTLPLARAGFKVTAIDHSDAMLAKLLQQLASSPAAVRARVTPARADLCQFELGQRFDLVIAVFNVVEHLYTRTEFAACMARVRHHLTPRARFAFDVQVPEARWLARDPSRRFGRTRFTHPTTGRKWIYSTNHMYDPVSQIALIRLFYDPVSGSGRRMITLSQRKYFPAELEALIDASQFVVEDRHGDFAGGPLTAESTVQIVVCRPK